ncbi:MAG: Hcp family type VI secretion system effector [Gemmataceae bacterium]
MPTSYYLKLTRIPGEVKVKPYEKWIEIESWSWGGSNSAGLSSGHGEGKVEITDLHYVFKYGPSSPKVAQFCASGEHIDEAILVAVRNGEIMRVTMTDVRVASYQSGGTPQGDSVPRDQVSLVYTSIVYKYGDQVVRHDSVKPSQQGMIQRAVQKSGTP